MIDAAAFLRIRPAAARALGVPARDVSVCLTYRAGKLVEAAAYWLRPGRGWTRAELGDVLPGWAGTVNERAIRARKR